VTASHQGKLLVASPTLLEQTFHRTVILLLEHSPRGALGVVLNRASMMGVDEPLPAWRDVAAPPRVIFHGGPVEVSSVLCLAWGGAPGGAGYRELLDGIGTLDLHKDPDDVVGIEGIRVFAGHAGWGPGQLDAELARKTWLVVDRVPADLSTSEPDTLWADVLARQPGIVPLLASYPEDVNLN
jgi:putative transcriptional regulator